MTKTEAKRIAANRIWSILDYIAPQFESMFDENLGDGYSDHEQAMILEQANVLADRLAKIVIPIATKQP